MSDRNSRCAPGIASAVANPPLGVMSVSSRPWRALEIRGLRDPDAAAPESLLDAKEVDPKLVFNRLFADRPNDPEAIARAALRASVLDSVREDAKDLANKLGGSDKQKLDQYLTGVRDLSLLATPPVDRWPTPASSTSRAGRATATARSASMARRR